MLLAAGCAASISCLGQLEKFDRSEEGIENLACAVSVGGKAACWPCGEASCELT